jgi:hypothetical protein
MHELEAEIAKQYRSFATQPNIQRAHANHSASAIREDPAATSRSSVSFCNANFVLVWRSQPHFARQFSAGCLLFRNAVGWSHPRLL